MAIMTESEITKSKTPDIKSTTKKELPTIPEITQFILGVGQQNTGTFGGKFDGGVQLQQVPGELAPCISELLKSKSEIHNYLEIGSAAGGLCYVFNHFFQLDKIILIDAGVHTLRNETLQGIFHQELIGRSDDEFVVGSVSKMNIQFDLIALDSDHSYQNVRLEAAIYLPFLRSGGFLFIHDTVYASGGSGRVVRELAASKDMELIAEYVADVDPKIGTGLLRKL
jgi:cephalosporin hydroxylase